MAHYLKNGLFGSRTRTLLLIAVIVAAIVFAWATRVFSQVQLGMPYAGVKPGGTVTQPGDFVYKFTFNKDRSAVTVSRNGADWVTITQNGSAFTLSDPTGTGKPITTFRSGAH